MSTVRRSIALGLALAVLGVTGAAASAAGAGSLAGRVNSDSGPVAAAGIYAYQLADMSLRKGFTDGSGRFLFEDLPAGLYKIIAAKSGFLPAVVLLTRATSEARQFLTVDLVEAASEAFDESSFWAIREQIPVDVLREIEATPFDSPDPQPGMQLAGPVEFHGNMQAVAGVDEHLGLGESQVTGGRFGVRGAIRDYRIGLTGDYKDLVSRLSQAGGIDGRAQLMKIDFEKSRSSRVQVTSLSNRLVTRDPSLADRVGIEQHRVSWSQSVGETGRSDFAAQYTEETNFYRQAAIDPMGIPEASRSWRVEGSYSTVITDRANIQAGFRYRERESEYGSLVDPDGFLLPAERMDLFGRGGLRVLPTVVVEYGLYSTMRDGSVALAPSGGVVLQIGPHWRAATSVSRRVYTDDVERLRQDFTPAYHGDYRSCDQAEQSCYRLLFLREGEGDQKLEFGAIRRRFADTQRLYFSKDFFNHLESLYLVSGDELPELQFAMTRRVSPTVLTRLESHLAAGGGGQFWLADSSPYENEVRYLVTSLDTRFETTSTGLFVAFHHLAQELSPMDRPRSEGPQMELERLQVMLTQDLDILSSLASDWAVHVNMEVSRGTTPSTSMYDAEELRKRLTGGIAVKF